MQPSLHTPCLYLLQFKYSLAKAVKDSLILDTMNWLILFC